VGPSQLLTAGTLDFEEDIPTVTLPLYEGRLERPGAPNDGAKIWYIVTDTSDKGNAEALGLNFSAKLFFGDLPTNMMNQLRSTSLRTAYYENPADGPASILVYQGGSVDFGPARQIADPRQSFEAANGRPFNPNSTDNLLSTLQFQPGAVGSDVGDPNGLYSPLVQITNAGGHVYNAPMVAFGVSEDDLEIYCRDEDSGEGGVTPENSAQAHQILHDSVVSICPGEEGEPGTVTMELVNGFSFGRPVQYLSTDASADIAAALEGAIFSPALANVPVGADDSLFSAIERIFGFTNGPVNVEGELNPQRQGFNSALIDSAGNANGPHNILGGIPTIATDYSPLWDLNLGEWTQEAIDSGYRGQLTEEFEILGFVENGFVTGPGGSAYGSVGIIINCPIVNRML